MAEGPKEKRVALVIGNGAYKQTPWLLNPSKDAAAISEALKRLDFEVHDGRDLEYAELAGRIRDFGRALRDAHVALFFYAGHGLQVRGESYIVPVDARLEQPADLQLELVAVQTILAQMEVGNRVSIVILDACRDNPLARNLERALGLSRSAGIIGEGLGQVQAWIGTYVSFATAPNRRASDGASDAGHSPFTSAILRHIETPDITISEIMMRVRRDVIEATMRQNEGPQIPWSSSSLVAPFYFKRTQVASREEMEQLEGAEIIDLAEQDWKRFNIAETEDTKVLEAYIVRYETSVWASRARRRLEVVVAQRAAKDPVAGEAADQPRSGAESWHEAAIARRLLAEKRWEPVTFTVGAEHSGRQVILKPGESFRDLDYLPEMVILPPGVSWIGTEKNQGPDHERHEQPRHQIIIPKAIAVGKYQVTFAEWEAYLADGAGSFLGLGKRNAPHDQGWGKESRPVINVSWNDAQNYIAWLNTKVVGAPYRLLSEAEWEYACRAGTETVYYFGNDPMALDRHAWYRTNANGRTQPVGGKTPNAFGLHDMHGNVSEWCADVWHDTYTDKPEGLNATGAAWTSGPEGHRVLRGGSWNSNPHNLRSADRHFSNPDVHYSGFGVRVARTLLS